MADSTGTQGTERIFDRETLLDLSVNFIPLVIILFFAVLFAVFRPFGVALVPTVVTAALLVIPFLGLAILTYFAGKVITEAERFGESDTAETVSESTTAIGEGETEPARENQDDESGDMNVHNQESNDARNGAATSDGTDEKRESDDGTD